MSHEEHSSGITASERLLFRLCRESFLQLWCYANLFRDQRANAIGDGKEICDALVVCGDDVVVFSDKSCVFPATGDDSRDWDRWYKNAVRSAMKQLAGAARWLCQHPRRVFVDRSCQRRFPEILPPADRMRIYRVAVVNGAKDRCITHFGGGSGSLVLASLREHTGEAAAAVIPFTVPLQDGNGSAVHILNEVTAPIVIGEMDTITDFIEYLKFKESMVQRGRLTGVLGEEDLLALHMQLGPDFQKILDDNPRENVLVPERVYADLRASPDYTVRKNQLEKSYFWDTIIANHASHVLAGQLVAGSVQTIEENEWVLRQLAIEARTSRMFLSTQYLDLIESAPRTQISSRVCTSQLGTMFAFQVHPREIGPTDESEYQRCRANWLQCYVKHLAWRYQSHQRVVGIATDGADPEVLGYTIFAFEVGEWTPELVAEAEKLSAIVTAHSIPVIEGGNVTHSTMQTGAVRAPSRATERAFGYRRFRKRRRRSR